MRPGTRGRRRNRIETWISEDLHSVHFAGLFGPDGEKLGG